MGKRKFAGTLSSGEHRTNSEKFANSLEVWIRGWDYGIEVNARQVEGADEFEIWTTGGSSAKSNGRKMIGTLTSKGFLHAG
jgi:hypothetical protein